MPNPVDYAAQFESLFAAPTGAAPGMPAPHAAQPAAFAPQFAPAAQPAAFAPQFAPAAQPTAFAPQFAPQFAPAAQPAAFAPAPQPAAFAPPLLPPGTPAQPQPPQLDIATELIQRFAQPAPAAQVAPAAPGMVAPPGALMPGAPVLPQMQAPAGTDPALAALLESQRLASTQQAEMMRVLTERLAPAPAAAPAPASPVDFDPARDQLTPEEAATYGAAAPVVQKLVKQALAGYHGRMQDAVVAPLQTRIGELTTQLGEATTRLQAVAQGVEHVRDTTTETALYSGLDPNIVAHIRAKSPHYMSALNAPFDARFPGVTNAHMMRTLLSQNNLPGVQALLRSVFTPAQPTPQTITAPTGGAALNPPGMAQQVTMPSTADFRRLQEAQMMGKITPDAAEGAMAAVFNAMANAAAAPH